MLTCVGDQENSEKTEVGACRRALDLGRYTWANSVPSGDRRKSATRRTKEEHHYRSLELVQFPGQRCQQTKGRCKQGGLSTRKVFGWSGRDQKRSELMRVPTRTQLVDGPTKSFTGAFLKNSPTSGIAQLHDGDTTALRQKQLTGIRTSEGCKWILSRKIGGSEDTTQEGPAQDPSLSTF